MKMAQLPQVPKGMKVIYFAGGCFWGTEKLFRALEGVVDVLSGYANGDMDIVPDYEKVCGGKTGYRETVRVVYDPKDMSLEQLLKVYFYVIDPTVEKRQGGDIGDQYQTGIYYTDDASIEIIKSFVEKERLKYERFAVEIEPLTAFFPAEEYHQDYLDKNPGGYCHIPAEKFEHVNEVAAAPASDAPYTKPDDETLRKSLTALEYNVTQNSATERPFSGKYCDFYEKGIYVDIATGEPLFSSLDKYPGSCGWPSFSAPVDSKNVVFRKDSSLGRLRTEVRSKSGDSHLGHIFYDDPESPNGVRYCINSAAVKFIPYDEMEEKGYGQWQDIF